MNQLEIQNKNCNYITGKKVFSPCLNANSIVLADYKTLKILYIRVQLLSVLKRCVI